MEETKKVFIDSLNHNYDCQIKFLDYITCKILINKLCLIFECQLYIRTMNLLFWLINKSNSSCVKLIVLSMV